MRQGELDRTPLFSDSKSFGENASFGALVQQRRTLLGMTRGQLALAVGCSPVTIKKIERDERRPSQQVAELLAEQLLIPPAEQSRFVRMARGELAVAPAALHIEEEMPLPPFLTVSSVPPGSDDLLFVAREAELARLQTHLAQAMRGSGQVVFIAGEAGCGKSVLAHAFARSSQESYPDLVVATGQCNAYTGSGDPYLPFREILEMLTGDIEFQASASKLHPNHTRRLWQIMPVTLRTLVEMGRDLFDTFLPTRQLLNRLASYLYRGASGLSATHQLVAALVEGKESAAGEGSAQQNALFEQYSRVMLSLARQAPLLLILDDLQWADAGSINLLFHLGRHLAGGHILIVGIYRPTDVALGRDGERHPLEAVVNELQRHFGNSPIVLGQSEGRDFVEALIDAHPNRLGAAFREALFRQTGGHALFTVEMLRGLREQGSLIQDAQGQWVEGSALSWSKVPARVEGIIKERLGRLPPALQESLKIASVEGESFTAEVIAAVQRVNVRELIGQLSSVLDRQQDLVRVLGVRRLGSDGQTLSQYRFRHILFQRFLYESLDEVERVHLHDAVGREMEQLYAGQVDTVALHLARHFAIAGDDTRALAYFVTAGDVAAAAYANTEAAAHYRRAMEIARRSTAASTTLIHLYTRLGRVLELGSHFDEALACYAELSQLARKRGDPTMEINALIAQSTLHITMTTLYDPAHGQKLLEEALRLARSVGDQAAEAKILWNLTTLNLYAGHAAQAIVYGKQSLELARALNLRELMAFTLNDMGLTYFTLLQFQQAKAVMQEASDLWRELGNRPMLADCLGSTCSIHLYAGEFEQAIACSQEAYEISLSVNNPWGQSYSRNLVGTAYWELGAPDTAIAMMEGSIRLAELANFPVPHVMTRTDLAVLFGALGAVERGLSLAQEALVAAERHVPVFRFYVLTRLALLHLWQGDVSAAEAYLQRATAAELEKPVAFYTFTYLVEAELALRNGDYGRAMRALDAVLPDLRHFGVRLFLAKALHLQAHVLLKLGQTEAARAALQEAQAEAAATGSRVTLWPLLMSLSQLEMEPAAAETLRGQAQAIVESIADRIPAPELRASFWALPDVRRACTPLTPPT